VEVVEQVLLADHQVALVKESVVLEFKLLLLLHQLEQVQIVATTQVVAVVALGAVVLMRLVA
jgi:hypothetical protein